MLWDQLRIILSHNTFELLTYDTRHGGVIAVKPNPFLECEFATLASQELTNGPGMHYVLGWGLYGWNGDAPPSRLLKISTREHYSVRIKEIQLNLDLVTNLVIPKTVTKSRVVTKFMVDTWWVSNIFKSNQDFKTMIYSKIIICLSVFQEQIFYYKLGNQMTPFFHEHESITFMSKEVFYV